MAEKTGLMDVIEQKLVPLANMVGKNKYLLTLRDTFSMIMPLLIVGSIFTLIGSFPFEPWTNLLKGVQVGDQTLSALVGVPATITVSMMALFVAFLIGYNFAEHEDLTDRASAGLCSLLCWLLLMPLYTVFAPEGSEEVFQVSSIPLDWVGSKGVFVAMIIGFASIKIYGWFVRKDFTIKMPDGVPPTVARAFSALIPMTVTIVVVWVLRIVFVLSPWENVFSFIYSFLQIPLQNLGGTVVAQAGVYLFAHFLWFFGIHGTNITDSVYNPILLSLSAQNQEAIAAGLPAPNIINAQFQSLFATIGGGGCTLSLLIAILIFCKSERLQKLARLCVAPGIFNINEPVIFGLPVVLNPVLFIPFILCPFVYIVLTYGVMALGLVPICNGVLVPWSTPAILSGFLVSGWQGAVWQAVLIALGVVIYLPFIKTLDKQYLAEQDARPVVSAASSELDEIDLDDIDFDSL